MKNKARDWLALSMILSNGYSFQEPEERIIDTSQKKILIPRGCKEYEFESSFGTFKTIASSEKSAKRKFDKWKLKQLNNGH